MSRYLCAVLLAFISLFTLISPTSAAIVSINKSGEVIMNVLPAHDEIVSSPEPVSLQVTNIANTGKPSEKAEVALRNTSGKVELSVNDGKGTQLADVTGYNSEIIEIEQRQAPSKISILASGEGFLLKERNISAYTSFPITIDPEQKKIYVETTAGEQYLGVLPSDALVQVIQGQIIDVIDGDYLILSNGELGEVQYTIHGKKTLDILNIFEYEVPVSAVISAANGNVISVEQPLWLPIASFLFT